jgi:dihydroorotase
MTEQFDIVITGGRVIDPASGLDGVRDIGIRQGRIAAVEESVATGGARTIDAAGLLVLPGMIGHPRTCL